MGHTHSSPSTSESPTPIDPLHDIDGSKTLIWSIAFIVLVFGGMWLLSASFSYFLDQEHQVKIFDREPTELKALRAQEAAELSKTQDLGNGRARISIEESMRRLVQKN